MTRIINIPPPARQIQEKKMQPYRSIVSRVQRAQELFSRFTTEASRRGTPIPLPLYQTMLEKLENVVENFPPGYSGRGADGGFDPQLFDVLMEEVGTETKRMISTSAEGRGLAEMGGALGPIPVDPATGKPYPPRGEYPTAPTIGPTTGPYTMPPGAVGGTIRPDQMDPTTGKPYVPTPYSEVTPQQPTPRPGGGLIPNFDTMTATDGIKTYPIHGDINSWGLGSQADIDAKYPGGMPLGSQPTTQPYVSPAGEATGGLGGPRPVPQPTLGQYPTSQPISPGGVRPHPDMTQKPLGSYQTPRPISLGGPRPIPVPGPTLGPFTPKPTTPPNYGAFMRPDYYAPGRSSNPISPQPQRGTSLSSIAEEERKRKALLVKNRQV